jgi:hypothetical protein
VPNVGRNVDTVKKQIGHAEDVGEMFFLNTRKALLNRFLMSCGLSLFSQVLNGTNKEASSATGGIKNGLP